MNEFSKKTVKVLVVGNPANTNALIAMTCAPSLPKENFTAMTRLDHNRALSQLAEKTGSHVTDLKQVIIWGNHSATQYPDINHCLVKGQAARTLVDQDWIEKDFIPTVQQRGAAIIKARGASSAASAASAAIDHVRDWFRGSPQGDWLSMGIPSDGSYGIPEGVMFGFAVTTENGEYTMVKDLPVDAFSQAAIDKTLGELEEERSGVAHLLG